MLETIDEEALLDGWEVFHEKYPDIEFWEYEQLVKEFQEM